MHGARCARLAAQCSAICCGCMCSPRRPVHFPTGVLDWLRNANETLAKTQKRVEDHLETKRQAFPRFCFLSNDELLEILAQARLDCLLITS